MASLDSDTQAIWAEAGQGGSDASKANWESEAAGNGPAKVALDGGLTFWEMDEELVNEFVTRTAPGFKDWTDSAGPNAEKWLAKALEILGR